MLHGCNYIQSLVYYLRRCNEDFEFEALFNWLRMYIKIIQIEKIMVASLVPQNEVGTVRIIQYLFVRSSVTLKQDNVYVEKGFVPHVSKKVLSMNFHTKRITFFHRKRHSFHFLYVSNKRPYLIKF